MFFPEKKSVRMSINYLCSYVKPCDHDQELTYAKVRERHYPFIIWLIVDHQKKHIRFMAFEVFRGHVNYLLHASFFEQLETLINCEQRSRVLTCM
jgi:hypothetical protein